ncbi:MAG: methylamine utilization protein [Acidimicrobiales bacterium]
MSGRLTILEKNKKPAKDLGDAVIWLEGPGSAGRTGALEVAIDDKVYVPRVLVVPVGATVRFPNHDPFRHNVFSVSEPNQFDLGLYGRGEAKSWTFVHPGLVRVFCNVHPRMVSYVHVMATHHYAQPAADGSFTVRDVEPGRYVLHAWHERVAAEVVQDLVVDAAGVADVQLTLDARGYKWQPHKDKNGGDYSGGGRERY